MKMRPKEKKGGGDREGWKRERYDMTIRQEFAFSESLYIYQKDTELFRASENNTVDNLR